MPHSASRDFMRTQPNRKHGTDSATSKAAPRSGNWPWRWPSGNTGFARPEQPSGGLQRRQPARHLWPSDFSVRPQPLSPTDQSEPQLRCVQGEPASFRIHRSEAVSGRAIPNTGDQRWRSQNRLNRLRHSRHSPSNGRRSHRRHEPELRTFKHRTRDGARAAFRTGANRSGRALPSLGCVKYPSERGWPARAVLHHCAIFLWPVGRGDPRRAAASLDLTSAC
jgi:hypothetical protein